MSQDNYEVGGWHLRKEVTIGQLITIATVAISGIWWAASVESRITKLKSEDIRIEQKSDIVIKGMADRFDRNQAAIEKAFAKIDRALERIEKKLDMKADK